LGGLVAAGVAEGVLKRKIEALVSFTGTVEGYRVEHTVLLGFP
jgi:hypothetical protein